MGFISSHKLLALVAALFCCSMLGAASEDDIKQLETEMLKYFSTKERTTFFRVTDKLKDACQEVGNERLYYRAWGNQGIYESTLQNYQQALDIAHDILVDAQENGSIYGEYAAMHAKAMILLQKQDYEAAEPAFLDAVEFLHKHYPTESAGEDLQELMKIANHRKDPKAGARYARQILNEPNVTPIHKGRALYRLSQMAFNQNNVEEFNRIYKEMMLLKEEEGISPLRPIVEVNHLIINGEYQQALCLADSLEDENCAERKAVIYHRMGDDANAYKYMQQYKRISDSITLVSHGNVVNSCYVQMNNDRLQLEQQQLERKNNQLLNRLYLSVAISLFLILMFIIWRGHRLVIALRKDNKQLIYERKDADRALTDLNELSYYESRSELDITQPVQLNKMCDRLADYTQTHCYKNVTMILQTDFSDDFELQSNPDALRKLLLHLLNYAARFTYKGYVKLTLKDAEDAVLFSVTDTSAGLGNKPKNHLIGLFAEQNNKIRYVGMNFYICQSITRLLQGRIWHDTEYTTGTRFCVELPKDPTELLNMIKIGGG